MKIGGATVHHSHQVAAFGNSQCRLVFCACCGGSTQGSFSPLLADSCRKNGSQTNMRYASRMLLKEKWPTDAMAQLHGQGWLSPTLCFVQQPGGHRIALAHRSRSA